MTHPLVYVDHVRALGEHAQLIVKVISLAFVMESCVDITVVISILLGDLRREGLNEICDPNGIYCNTCKQ